ncbi:pilus assembly PilX family protein [Uliginosibacterium aquaticum]|uniref:Type 4 fimbrial biogenesis protein PilX N-terminal domain-containing protein n=1 Tax=Uliginosibacterium aquaticum TaxID=2731212 RepID=A0ABX2IKR5_9RHOO|nr:PilX N-terminal domain-containing pilus assembly protein [Uliginosibacterium aquaticum]NSL55269.1 hypothetical protein [Uliginosibacterium aquaticum]
MRHSSSFDRQRGAALLVSLIMLILVSLLAAAGFMLSTGEARGAAGWSDRQRSMFTAEGALKEAEVAVASLVASSQDIETALNGRSGYFLRKNGNVPDFDPWPVSSSISATQPNSGADNAYYIVVYEGKAVGSNDGMLSGGRVNQTAAKPRFTLYAKAGGIKEGTYVVLSTSKEF